MWFWKSNLLRIQFGWKHGTYKNSSLHHHSIATSSWRSDTVSKFRYTSTTVESSQHNSGTSKRFGKSITMKLWETKLDRMQFETLTIVLYSKTENFNFWKLIWLENEDYKQVKWTEEVLQSLNHPAIFVDDFSSHHNKWKYNSKKGDGCTCEVGWRKHILLWQRLVHFYTSSVE